MLKLAKLAARLSAQFTRERPHDHVDAIASDAIAAAKLALSLKAKRTGKAQLARKPKKLKDLDKIAKKYAGNVVTPSSDKASSIGIRFTSPRGGGLFPLVSICGLVSGCTAAKLHSLLTDVARAAGA